MKPALYIFTILAALALANCNKSAEDSPADKSPNGEAKSQQVASPDSLLGEIIVEMRGFAEAMNSVNDRASAESAAARIKKHAEAALRIAKEMEKLDIPSESEKNQLAAKWQKCEEDIRSKPRPDRSKMKDPQEVRKIMRSGMQTAGNTLTRADEILRKYGIQLTHSK
ncbi:MAG: hypothetical protein AB8F34_08600 [Akkermansiaceae bacterium]